ncbi:hypothetical protein EYZ11_001140 [Aspergillus tanneri]|uniref:Uncharacterized protein n=1 Tax=Aspergillus tanneri TaxID=1220188 RepID=A0A4S3JVG7_9EURO|nr:hypothetical protein EYZ11_001140 [Aspergillus tanneri]
MSGQENNPQTPVQENENTPSSPQPKHEGEKDGNTLNSPQPKRENGDTIKQEPDSDNEPAPRKQEAPEFRRRMPHPRLQRYRQDSETDAFDYDMENAPVERPRRQRRQHRQLQEQQDGVHLGGLPGVRQAGDLVQNTAGNARNGVTGSAGKAVGDVLGSKKNEGGEEGGKGEQLRLRLDLNLDIEVQLKAKIHGDLTLANLPLFSN